MYMLLDRYGPDCKGAYDNYRTYADNRIGLLEHYLESTCHNLGYKQFDYDKETLNVIRAKCVDKFTGVNNLPDNITWNAVQGVVYHSRNQQFDINRLLMRPKGVAESDG